MLTHEPSPIQPKAIRFRQARLAMRQRATATWQTLTRKSADPLLPILLLGVLAATFFFAFVLNAPKQLIFGVFFIGCLTAFIESNRHNDR